jgi:hypothetical protein
MGSCPKRTLALDGGGLKGILTLGCLEALSDTTLGSDRLRTGPLVMAKRLNTASTWPMSNNPRGSQPEPANPCTAPVTN